MMAYSFNANQYEPTFWSHRLCNYEVPHAYRKKPLPRQGFTQFNSNDRGHLQPNLPNSMRCTVKNPWGDYVSAWELPKKLPGPRTLIKTARNYEAHDKLIREMYKLQPFINGIAKNARRPMKHEDGTSADKPARLGSMSPSHEVLTRKDYRPYVETKPDAPKVDAVPEDDYEDERTSHKRNGQDLIENNQEEQVLNESPGRGITSKHGGSPFPRPRKPTDGNCSTPQRSSNSDCSSVSEDCRLAEVKNTLPPMEVPIADYTYAFTNVFDQESESGPCLRPSPLSQGSVSPKSIPTSKPMPEVCMRRSPSIPSPLNTACQTMYGFDEDADPVLGNLTELMTEPMRLPPSISSSPGISDRLFSL